MPFIKKISDSEVKKESMKKQRMFSHTLFLIAFTA